MEVLEHVISKSPKTMCIILTGHGTIKSSVDAIKKGAFDYITKPVSPSELLVVVEKALKFKNLEEENIRLKKELRGKYNYTNLVGTSKAIKKIYDLIEKVADTDGTILITGASGTGKELIARAIHYTSNRSDKPLVVVSCGAIPEALLESELFGHEKGAFTGAFKKRIGRFEMANGGTIFLDEIGEMSPALQVKLLRVLQEQKFERVGGTKTIHVDLRIIAATHRNLTSAINNETFREDLYYRLNVIPIKVPSLRKRKSDIPLLLDFFLKKFQRGKEKRVSGFLPAAMDAMIAYDWPGNVRELENVVKRLTILCENQMVSFDDLPEIIQEKSRSFQSSDEVIMEQNLNFHEAVRDYEKKIILEALEKSNWVKSKAAKLLNINRTTLVAKIKKQNIDVDNAATG
jgi:DNA-binding NtrC family response regulator